MAMGTCVICKKEFLIEELHMVSKDAKICVGCLKRIGRVSSALENNSFSYSFEQNNAESSSHAAQGYKNAEISLADEDEKPLMLTPTKIRKGLDDYVVGQDEAKKILSVAAYNHYKRIELNDDTIGKSNVLLVGPTGCGKTHLVRTLAKILNVPVCITPCTSLTSAGYIGDDVETVIQKLFVASGRNKELTEKGIVFIDEIDKLNTSGAGASSKDVGGKSVQQALLPILEGTDVEVVEAEKGPIRKTCTINTSNILFICGGAFPDMEKIIAKRLGTATKNVGFSIGSKEESVSNYDEDNLLTYTTMDDLREFGMIPEFLGRLPVLASLENLSVEVLKRILVEPKDAITKQYQKLFAYDEISLVFRDDALDYIAKTAREKKTGARSLRSVLEKGLLNLMYELPDREDIGEVVITLPYISGEKDEPEYKYRGEKTFY